jgi:hypothetical protein
VNEQPTCFTTRRSSLAERQFNLTGNASEQFVGLA